MLHIRKLKKVNISKEKVKNSVKRIIIHDYYQLLRLIMQKRWQKEYIDYMENFRFSKHYDFLHRKMFELLEQERQDIVQSSLKRKYVAFRIAILGTLFGEEPDYYWGRDWPGSTLKQRLASITGVRINYGKALFNDHDKLIFLNDKVCFATHWREYFGRTFCCPQEVTEEQFCELFKGSQKVVSKPKEGSMGAEFKIYYTQGMREKLVDIYRAVIAEKPTIVEEYVSQSGILHTLNPSSLNTIRVITIRMNDRIIPASAYLRLGGKDAVTDNLHTGGVKVVIRMSDGKLLDGMTRTRNHLKCHPSTGIRFTGLNVPRWSEVLDFCVRAHYIAPNGLDLIGWDVCVDDEHLLMIEGNGCPGFGPYRKGNPNCWKLFKEYFNYKENG